MSFDLDGAVVKVELGQYWILQNALGNAWEDPAPIKHIFQDRRGAVCGTQYMSLTKDGYPKFNGWVMVGLPCLDCDGFCKQTCQKND